jgi:serine/threonine protein kinase
MSDGDQPHEDPSSPDVPETVWRGGESDAMDPFHESATILRPLDEAATIPGGLDSQPAAPGPAAPGPGSAPLTDLDEFRRAVVEVGLIGEEELDALTAELPSTSDVLGLARVLQIAGKLTTYQTAAVYQRKSRGLLIGNYLILDKLGAGMMGMVFKALHRRLGRVVALKILPPSFTRDRTAVLRFKREVEAAGKLKHPNIVAALDANEDRGVLFLVMEYVEGRDLDHVVRRRGPLPVRDAIDFLIQAARGLEAAHAAGIVHRDIKPSNLMLDNAGGVRVLDLGLARIVDASNPFGQASGSRLTESGMYMGAIDYRAPEQAEGSRRADHRADIYSLGCTLYYLMTGREPFVGDTVLKGLMAHQERPAPALRATRPDAPSALEDAFQQMMAKRPADRPESMTAVIVLLESCQCSAPSSRGADPDTATQSRPELRIFDQAAAFQRAAPAKQGREPSNSAGCNEAEEAPTGSALSLEDLVMDVRSEVALPPLPAPTIQRTIKSTGLQPPRSSMPRSKSARRAGRPAIFLALAAMAALGVAFVGRALLSRSPRTAPNEPARAKTDRVEVAGNHESKAEPSPSPATHDIVQTIFDGRTGRGWMLTDRKPLPPGSIETDGLNPHRTRSYLIVYEKKLGDFVLDCDYKLSKGSNSGVFLRVGDLNDPVHTGIEVALDDTTGAGIGDSGAFYGLVAPSRNAQKPAGQWNHLTITAAGSVLEVTLNADDVSWIDLDEWSVPGKRPDGTDHPFQGIAIANLPRRGYLGFQNLKGDCWFRHIKLRTRGGPSSRPTGDPLSGSTSIGPMRSQGRTP